MIRRGQVEFRAEKLVIRGCRSKKGAEQNRALVAAAAINGEG